MTQEAVLNSFLLAYVGTCESADEVEANAFMLDTAIFDTKLKKRIAERINDETAGEKAYSVLDVELEEKIIWSSNDRMKQEYIEIISASPLGIKRAKILHDRLVMRKRIKGAS